MLTNAGGDLSLKETPLPVKEAKVNRRQDISMLLSNGFATLFLVFHPYYINGFEFTDAGSETLDGDAARKIHFQHIPNTRSVAALALRGREYPLELSGTVWVDPQSGNILRIEAGIRSTLQPIRKKNPQPYVPFAPPSLNKGKSKNTGSLLFWVPHAPALEG